MMNTTKLLSQDTPRKLTGMQADAILQGPKSMIWNSETKDEIPFLYGWAILSLTTTTATLPACIESRSVYADLTDDSQEFAILRAVYWDWAIARKATKAQKAANKQESKIKQNIPARFIKLPITQLVEWLSAFDNVSTSVDEPCTYSKEGPIRGLRVERDYTACIFEKVWQEDDTEHSLLKRQWNKIWQQMTEALINEPIVSRVQEDYWLINLEPNYDFDAYKPNKFEFS